MAWAVFINTMPVLVKLKYPFSLIYPLIMLHETHVNISLYYWSRRMKALLLLVRMTVIVKPWPQNPKTQNQGAMG